MATITDYNNYIFSNGYVGSAISSMGRRENNEDKYLVSEIDGNLMLCVFDGHGGVEVSQYCKDNFNSIFKNLIDLYVKSDNILSQKNAFSLEKDITNFFINEFKRIDRSLKNLNYSRVGSTASLVFIINGVTIGVNLGDSRFIIKTKDTKIISTDHRPEQELEKQRILKTRKIINKRISGIINVSRSFGDFFFKSESPESISYIPDVYLLNKCPEFILIATDGLFDSLGDNNFISDYVEYMLGNGVQIHNIIMNMIIYCIYLLNATDNITIVILSQRKGNPSKDYRRIILELQKSLGLSLTSYNPTPNDLVNILKYLNSKHNLVKLPGNNINTLTTFNVSLVFSQFLSFLKDPFTSSETQ